MRFAVCGCRPARHADHILAISPDEKDNRIYECAEESHADFIVTGNARHFRKGSGVTKILNARQLLSLIEAE